MRTNFEALPFPVVDRNRCTQCLEPVTDCSARHAVPCGHVVCRQCRASAQDEANEDASETCPTCKCPGCDVPFNLSAAWPLALCTERTARVARAMERLLKDQGSVGEDAEAEAASRGGPVPDPEAVTAAPSAWEVCARHGRPVTFVALPACGDGKALEEKGAREGAGDADAVAGRPCCEVCKEEEGEARKGERRARPLHVLRSVGEVAASLAADAAAQTAAGRAEAEVLSDLPPPERYRADLLAWAAARERELVAWEERELRLVREAAAAYLAHVRALCARRLEVGAGLYSQQLALRASVEEAEALLDELPALPLPTALSVPAPLPPLSAAAVAEGRLERERRGGQGEGSGLQGGSRWLAERLLLTGERARLLQILRAAAIKVAPAAEVARWATLPPTGRLTADRGAGPAPGAFGAATVSLVLLRDVPVPGAAVAPRGGLLAAAAGGLTEALPPATIPRQQPVRLALLMARQPTVVAALPSHCLPRVPNPSCFSVASAHSSAAAAEAAATGVEAVLEAATNAAGGAGAPQLAVVGFHEPGPLEVWDLAAGVKVRDMDGSACEGEGRGEAGAGEGRLIERCSALCVLPGGDVAVGCIVDRRPVVAVIPGAPPSCGSPRAVQRLAGPANFVTGIAYVPSQGAGAGSEAGTPLVPGGVGTAASAAATSYTAAASPSSSSAAAEAAGAAPEAAEGALIASEGAEVASEGAADAAEGGAGPAALGHLLAVGADAFLRVWARGQDGEFVPQGAFEAYGHLRCLCLLPAQLVAVGGAYGAEVWDWRAGRRLLTFATAPLVQGVAGLALHASGGILVASMDGAIFAGAADRWGKLTLAARNGASFAGVVGAADGSSVTANAVGQVHVWRGRVRESQFTDAASGANPLAVVGERVAYAGTQRRLMVHSPA